MHSDRRINHIPSDSTVATTTCQAIVSVLSPSSSVLCPPVPRSLSEIRLRIVRDNKSTNKEIFRRHTYVHVHAYAHLTRLLLIV